MKMMKTLLCILLSLIMALGMVGASAEALLDGSVTLRNVSISIDDQTFNLPQQVKLRGNVQPESAALRFEVINGENVLLPIAGEVDAEGVRFSLDDTGRVYSLDMATITEFLGGGETLLPMINSLFGMINSYFAAMEAIVDPANEDAIAQWATEVLTTLLGDAHEVEMDINGEAYTGLAFENTITMDQLLATIELYDHTGIAEYDAFWQEYFAFLSQSSGMELNSFADLKPMLMEDGLTEEDLAMELGNMEMTMGGDEEVACVRMSMDVAMDDELSNATLTCEMIETAEACDLTMVMEVEEGDFASTEFSIALTADMAENELAGLNADMYITSSADYLYDDGFISNDDAGVVFTLSADQEGGLWNGEMALGYSVDSTFGYEAESLTSMTQLIATGVAIDQVQEEDGSITTAVAIEYDQNDDVVDLAFELNCSDASALEALVGEDTTVYPLTADEEDPAYTMISADAMALMADILELSADENIMALAEYFGSQDEMGIYEGDAEAYTYETVYSFEDAAQIYTGAMPSFAAPEGFALSYIDVTETDLYAEYANEDYSDYVAFYLVNYGEDLSEMGNKIGYYGDGEGNIVSADFVSGETYVVIYFNVDTQEAAEAIVAGFSF